MSHDLSLSRSTAGDLIARIPAQWRAPLLQLTIGWLAIFALTLNDWLEMFDLWWNISTYNHALFVPLILGWLIYARRNQLAEIRPSTWWPGLIALAGALLLWLLGDLAGVNSASQLGAVLALQGCVLAILGPRVGLASLFPLAYMLFLVPFGDELVPALQMITADMVIALTAWSNIPAVVDGVFIDTPAGLFEVAEECSGVKFLIAMTALGTLISYTCFESWKRRALFMTAALALPILANGVRAWGTIFIAQSQGIEFAEGFDHIFYGWVFFALVVGGLLAVSWRWFDRDPEETGIDFPAQQGKPWLARLSAMSLKPKPMLAVVIGMALSVAAWSTLASRVEAAVPDRIAYPEIDDWQQIDFTPEFEWNPKATGADHKLLGRFRSSAGYEVDVVIALYAAQEDGREASAHGEGAFDPNSHWRWIELGPKIAEADSQILLVAGNHKRLVQTTYRVGDMTTGSAAKLRLANMRDRLLLRERPTSMLIISSELQDERLAAQSATEFRQSIGDAGEWLDRIAGLR